LQGVPYRAIANAVADLIGGEINCLFMDTTASNQYLQNGQLRPLAITRLKRAPATPDVPAVAETFPGFELTGFLGMAVPSATPRDIVEQLNGLINEALAAPAVRSRMDEFGLSWDITDLTACEADVRAERDRPTEIHPPRILRPLPVALHGRVQEVQGQAAGRGRASGGAGRRMAARQGRDHGIPG
jgi:tripartite-type tricarboxylate transporter receptor subunit TctC